MIFHNQEVITGLQEKLNTMKKDSTASWPPEVVTILQEEFEKLVNPV